MGQLCSICNIPTFIVHLGRRSCLQIGQEKYQQTEDRLVAEMQRWGVLCLLKQVFRITLQDSDVSGTQGKWIFKDHLESYRAVLYFSCSLISWLE